MPRHDAILQLQQQKILSLTEELAEEQAESKRCNKEVLDLTALLHEKEELLLDARNFMEEVEAKMEKAVREQAGMLAQNRLLVKAKARVEEKAHFKVRELELRLEKANAVDERFEKRMLNMPSSLRVPQGAAQPSLPSKVR